MIKATSLGTLKCQNVYLFNVETPLKVNSACFYPWFLGQIHSLLYLICMLKNNKPSLASNQQHIDKHFYPTLSKSDQSQEHYIFGLNGFRSVCWIIVFKSSCQHKYMEMSYISLGFIMMITLGFTWLRT